MLGVFNLRQMFVKYSPASISSLGFHWFYINLCDRLSNSYSEFTEEPC